MRTLTRRGILQGMGLALLSGSVDGRAQTKPDREPTPIAALVPRGSGGHQFVVYADCTSGQPGTPQGRNFAAVNRIVTRLRPRPNFVCFPGDHIMGYNKDYAVLRAQWDYWAKSEMAWLDRDIPIFHTTSNHNTYDIESERIWREVFPGIPRNGAPGQEGLCYYIRRGNLLLVCVNTSFSGLGGYGHVESDWLDRVLKEHADATYKFVAGHHPIHAVNGYARYPVWRVVPEQGEAFWTVLVRHRVVAYLCSHIIAFDVQVHDGVLQITTGGAGTVAGPGGSMPGQTEYLHAVQMAIDSQGLRYQVLGTDGTSREWLDWPLSIPRSDLWKKVEPGAAPNAFRTAWDGTARKEGGVRLCMWRFSAVLQEGAPGGAPQTLLCGWDDSETVSAIWVGFEGCPPRLTVQLLPESGGGGQLWRGPIFKGGAAFDFQLALHSGMGPGGILYRPADAFAWSSLKSSSARGAERMPWPRSWAIGCGPSGSSDQPFLGDHLELAWMTQVLSRVE
jgi:hypothetical protein